MQFNRSYASLYITCMHHMCGTIAVDANSTKNYNKL